MSKDYSNVKAYSTQKPQAQSGVQTVAQMLASNIKAIRSALPKHMTPERVARVAINFISKSPQLQKCTPASLCGAIMEASSLGLEIDMRGLAYLVPYGNQAQLQIGYKGLMDLAYRSGQVKQFYADVIGENDTYNVSMGLEPKLEHIPNLRGRGEIIAAYAIAVMADGSKEFVVVTREDIDKVREASKSGKSGPWATWFDEMAKKVAVKRLCKLLPLSPEVQKAAAIDDLADAGLDQVFEYGIEETATPQTENQASKQQEVEEAKPETEKTADPQEELKEVSINPDYEFTCPKNGKMVKEENCDKCADRQGCPEWVAM